MARGYQAVLYVLAPVAALGIVLHIVWGLACAGLVFPLLPQRARNRIVRRWSRMLLRISGIRVQLSGEAIESELAATGIAPSSNGRLLLLNHTSWIDIFAIDAVVPTRFIAKSEIAAWPIVGWLVSLSGTLFVERGKRHAVALINQAVTQQLAKGESIGVFPEGTTTAGDILLPFHANLIQPALDVNAELRPVAVRYTQSGVRSEAAAYIGEMNLVQSLWKVLTAPHLTVELIWLPAVPLALHGNRHAVARAARDAIAQALGLAESISPPALAAPGIAPELQSAPANEAQ